MSGTLADAKLIATARRDRAPLGSLPDGVVARDHSGVALRHDDFVSVGVECEIAVRLGRDLKPSDAPFTADTAAQAIGAYVSSATVSRNGHTDVMTLCPNKA